MSSYTQKIEENCYVKCRKCGVIRNIKLAAKCPICQERKIQEEINQNPKSAHNSYLKSKIKKKKPKKFKNRAEYMRWYREENREKLKVYKREWMRKYRKKLLTG